MFRPPLRITHCLLTFVALQVSVPARAESPLEAARALQTAFYSGDADRALALFTEDAVVINSRGRRIEGKDNLVRYVRGTTGAGLTITPDAERESGERAYWYNAESSPAYAQLGVTVRLSHMATIRDGRIVLFVTWFTPESVAEIRRACDAEDRSHVTIFGQPCAQFAAQASAFTEIALREYAIRP
jgi:ketosteroid isomerase-like protein